MKKIIIDGHEFNAAQDIDPKSTNVCATCNKEAYSDNTQNLEVTPEGKDKRVYPICLSCVAILINGMRLMGYTMESPHNPEALRSDG